MRSHSLMLGSLTINQSTKNCNIGGKNPEVWVFVNNFSKNSINIVIENRGLEKSLIVLENCTQEGGSVATGFKSIKLLVLKE